MTLFLGGDVMTGRGVDQILPHPGDPRLWERYVRDARGYVALAEQANGPIPRPVDASWPWGEALPLLDQVAPDARVINVETSITRSDDVAPGKAVHYRMNPANVGCLAAGRPDVCVLANNHILDFGRRGLADTLDTLDTAGIVAVGAGRDASQAERPAIVPLSTGNRLIALGFGSPSSGIPPDWAATPGRAGVNLLPEVSTNAADEIAGRIQQARQPGDIVVVSIHWGSNWGYQIPSAQIGFAHRLVDRGVDLIHGHSSHHPRPIEVYRGKLILYGCGDLIDDYEGIRGHEAYRNDLRLLYFAAVHPNTGHLLGLRMAPMQARRMRLHHADADDAEHLRRILDSISHRFGVRIAHADDGSLQLRTDGP